MISWCIRNIIWPVMERVKGNKIRTYLNEMKYFQNKTKDEINSFQYEKLRKLIEHSIRNVPAYKQYLGDLENEINNNPHWDPIQFIQKIPVLTKLEFNKNTNDYLSDDIDKTSLIPNRTGGSTGEPTRFYLDRYTVEHFEAARWLGLSWSGINIEDPSVMVWGSSIELNQSQNKRYQLKERFLKNRLIISAYEIKESNIDTYIEQINSFKPKYLYGYPSALSLLAEMMLRNKKTIKTPLKAIVATAETLQPKQRDLISRAFHCNVINEYGARDGGIIAYECQKGNMHMSAKNCYLEVVDIETKQPLEDGEKGLLLVTDLNNFSMPRLRYQLGDIASLSKEKCSCGINLPILESLEGRVDDVFVSKDGSYVHGNYFNQIMWKLDSFSGYQLIQHTPDTVTLKLVRKRDSYNNNDETVFRNEIYKVLGNIHLSISLVDEIPRSSSGKVRYAIREFPLN